MDFNTLHRSVPTVVILVCTTYVYRNTPTTFYVAIYPNISTGTPSAAILRVLLDSRQYKMYRCKLRTPCNTVCVLIYGFEQVSQLHTQRPIPDYRANEHKRCYAPLGQAIARYGAQTACLAARTLAWTRPEPDPVAPTVTTTLTHLQVR